ncbi:glutamate 5-kinase [Aquimarina agarivorans]|uniref:glutamate 5-kinase n=1 Tax=Aquimarina agarivorans TaxID=980584 RepID=UPI000248EAA1|nr:glutamate 5-kinase [Aquimarina agarivorans]
MAKDKSVKKRLLLKIGSNTLTKETNAISREKLADIARQIAILKKEYDFIIVSSGAVAAAKEFVQLQDGDANIVVKQALASIGQPYLMRLFQEAFSEENLLTSQCLLSYADFENKDTQLNISNTISVLLDNGYIPIINENDTVSTEEIKFGDNDKLAALTAALLDVDLCVIATNTYGIYTKASMKTGIPKTILEVTDLNVLLNEVSDDKSSHGTGGMTSKIQAAEILQANGIELWIVNGLVDNFLIASLSNKDCRTSIKPSKFL